MAAYAEGFNILKHANVGKSAGVTDAETTPRFATPSTISTISTCPRSRSSGGAAA
jgi:hypothetical protein